MNNKIKLFEENQKDFLNYLKSRYYLYHLSNVFFRDIHYGVMAYLELKGMKQGYSSAEDVTKTVIESLEGKGLLQKTGHMTWMLDYPEFKKPAVKQAAVAKPAAPPAAAKPAAPAAPKLAITSQAPTT